VLPNSESLPIYAVKRLRETSYREVEFGDAFASRNVARRGGCRLRLLREKVCSASQPLYSIPLFLIDGTPTTFGALAHGNVTLVVNVASQCGFTGQYAGLQQLYAQYAPRGFTIVATPSNDFGGQEPGDSDEIARFACSQFNVTFPLTEKMHVNGAEAHPLWAALKAERPGWFAVQRVWWNFAKMLLSHEGRVVERYSSLTPPASIEGDILRLLADRHAALRLVDGAATSLAQAPGGR
jgi:glutathione peroxidase